MNIVDITDIESLIIAKHEIDTLRIEENEIEERTNLNDFVNSYAAPQYVYIIDKKQISFNYVKVYDKEYLFVSDTNEEYINIIMTKLKLLKYDMNNLVEISRLDVAKRIDIDHIIIHDNRYFM